MRARRMFVRAIVAVIVLGVATAYVVSGAVLQAATVVGIALLLFLVARIGPGGQPVDRDYLHGLTNGARNGDYFRR